MRPFPSSLPEARALLAYHERIARTSLSTYSGARSERLVARMRAHLAALEQAPAVTVVTVPEPPPLLTRPVYVARDTGIEYEVTWNGGEGLSGMTGHSSLKALAGLGLGVIE